MGHTCYSLYPKYYGESKLIDSQIDDFLNAEYDFRAPVVWNLQNYFCSIMMRGDRFAIFCIPDGLYHAEALQRWNNWLGLTIQCLRNQLKIR